MKTDWVDGEALPDIWMRSRRDAENLAICGFVVSAQSYSGTNPGVKLEFWR